MLRAPHPHPAADAGRAPVEAEAQLTSDGPVPPPRQCGRCRSMFDGDPTLYPPAQQGWWVCPPCRAALFGRRPAPSGTARLEVAQRVWQRSLGLASGGAQLDLPDQALALLRAARHDADTLTHALGLGRSQARHPSHDEATRRGVRLLESTITYLGVKAQPGEIARAEPP
jgi:hypothetical protein